VKRRKPTAASLKKYASILTMSTICALTLSACGGSDNNGTPTSSNTVNVSADSTATGTLINSSKTVTLTFNSDGGSATNLQITATTLPSGWSANTSFSCPSVTTSGATCQLTLTYTPTAAEAQKSFTVNYSYTDATGATKTGTITITYSAVDPASVTAFAYITQRGAAANGGSILKCNVQANGSLADCADSGAGAALPGPVSLALSGKSIYFVNEPVGAIPGSVPSAYSVWQCSVDATTGALSGCAASGASETDGLSDFIVNNSNAYSLKRFGNQILKCTVDAATGAVAPDCAGQDTATGLSEPVNFVISGDKLYVANSDHSNSSVSICTVDATTGAVSSCGDANASAYDFTPTVDIDGVPTKVGVGPTGIAISNSTAYIVSSVNGNVVRCTIDATTGKFSACENNALISGATISPNRIAVQGNYAYITSTSSTAANNSIIECSIGSGGVLENCAAASVAPASFTSEISDIKLLPTVQ